MLIAFVAPHSSLAVAAGAGYLAVGSGVAWLLARRGHSQATALSAIACWPLLVSLLHQSPRPARRGPLADRIDSGFEALLAVVRDPAAGEIPWEAEIASLRDSMHRADERLLLVDSLLADTGGADVAAPLLAARGRAAAEIEAVLAGVVQLRLQIGLLTLAGNQAPVRDRLLELAARVDALGEIARLP